MLKIIKKIEEIGIRKRNKILAVMPHPDDEAFFSAALINQATRIGCDVFVLTITKGEKSTLKFGYPSNVDLGIVRPRELKNALEVLGVKKYKIANIPDGKIKDMFVEVRAEVLKKVNEFGPDILLTLEPSGIYGHPDHVELSKIVTEQYNLNKKKIRLIYSTVDIRFKPSEGALNMAKGNFIYNPLHPNVELKLSLGDVLNKIRALKAHRSQFQMNKFVLKMLKRGLLASEFYHIADENL